MKEITAAELAMIAAQLMGTGIAQKGAIDRAYRLYLDCQQFIQDRKPKASQEQVTTE